jgi:septal ring factor EnvC (AmiA/AmiB activator)
MTWGIFLGIVELVTFLIAIGVIIAKASQTMASLKAAVDMLIEQLKDSKSDRKELHGKVDDHETRIGILEHKVDRPNN